MQTRTLTQVPYLPYKNSSTSLRLQIRHKYIQQIQRYSSCPRPNDAISNEDTTPTCWRQAKQSDVVATYLCNAGFTIIVSDNSCLSCRYQNFPGVGTITYQVCVPILPRSAYHYFPGVSANTFQVWVPLLPRCECQYFPSHDILEIVQNCAEISELCKNVRKVPNCAKKCGKRLKVRKCAENGK